jgi:hypothetical protein
MPSAVARGVTLIGFFQADRPDVADDFVEHAIVTLTRIDDLDLVDRNHSHFARPLLLVHATLRRRARSAMP